MRLIVGDFELNFVLAILKWFIQSDLEIPYLLLPVCVIARDNRS